MISTQDLPGHWRRVFDAFEMAGVGHAVADLSGRIVYYSPMFSQYTGLEPSSKDTAAPWFLRDEAPPGEHRDRAQLWQIFLQAGQRWRGVVRWYLPDGKTRYFEGTACHLDDGHVILVTNDRTALIETDRGLREAELLREQVLQDLPLAVCVRQAGGRYLHLNRHLLDRFSPDAGQETDQLASLFGGETDIDLEASTGDAADGADEVARVVKVTSGPLNGTHWLVIRKQLSDRAGRSLGELVICLDRTDSVRLRRERALFAEAVHENQKVLALNDFAGSLAHELSNLLHPIGAYARMLVRSPDHPDREALASKINQATLSAGRILRRTLALARTDHVPAEEVSLTEIVGETIESANDLAPGGLEFAFGPRPPTVAVVKAGELRQVLLNLLNNAAEAMHYRGTVKVSLADGLPRPKHLATPPTAQGTYARLTVEDSGPGIPEDIRGRIFDPFFTTKPVGRGTGLGLAVAQGLVMGWGGVLSVDTRPGEGTAFHVWIPQTAMRD